MWVRLPPLPQCMTKLPQSSQECSPRCQRGDRRFESGRKRVRRGACWSAAEPFKFGHAGSIPAHGAEPPSSSGQDTTFSASRPEFDSPWGCSTSWGGGRTVRHLLCTQTTAGSTPALSTSRYGGQPVHADDAHMDARLLAGQEVVGSRPAIRSRLNTTPAWRNR